MKAKLKRAGVTWPTDKHDNTRPGKPYPATIRAVEAALARLGNPTDRVRSQDLMHALAEVDPPIARSSVRRYMLWAGWEPRGNTVAMTFVRPEASAPVNIAEWMDPAPAEAAPVEAEAEPTPEAAWEPVTVEAPPAVREFIDSADSWTLDLDALADMPLADVRRVLQATGLEVEFRVWRHGASTP